MNPINRLLSVMARLRDPQRGCAWDLAQGFETLAPHTIEEAYEVDDAIQRKDYSDLQEELGDLLFQVIFHSQLAAEKSYFDFYDVVKNISDKMIRRHPHLFAGSKDSRVSPENETWDSMKTKERALKSKLSNHAPSILDGVAISLPALIRSCKLQKRASLVGFDWPDIPPVLGKVSEELNEVREVLLEELDTDRITEELGDLLFSCTNLARHCGVDPEKALRQANEKFEHRFKRLEELMEGKLYGGTGASLEEMQGLWEQVKSEEPESN